MIIVASRSYIIVSSNEDRYVVCDRIFLSKSEASLELGYIADELGVPEGQFTVMKLQDFYKETDRLDY